MLKTNPETFARQITELLKDARDRALLNSNIVRLHIDLDSQEYWLEEAPDSILIPSQAEQDKILAEEKRAKEAEKNGEKDQRPSDGFRLLREITKDKRKIPRGLKFVEVISPRNKKPILEGDAFIYFFPRGGADNGIIHLQDEDDVKVSVVVQPVTGLSRYRSGFLSSEDTE